MKSGFFSEFLGKIALYIKVMRVWEWADKFHVNFIASLILLIYIPNPERYYRELLFLGAYIMFLGSYGYAINSFADMKQDRPSGKGATIKISRKELYTIFVLSALGSLGLPFLPDSPKILLFGIITFFLVTSYSLKPVRLKERGFLGVLAAALTQRPLPFLLFAFLVPGNPVLENYLFGWLFLIGLSIIVNHQIYDFDSDRLSKVNTWVQNLGIKKARNVVWMILIFTLFYLSLPILILPFFEGLAISVVLLVFSNIAISNSIDNIRKHATS